MKALTVRNPWAWAIIFGGKDVENRSIRTNHIGAVAIHTSKAVDTEGMRSDLILDAIDEYNDPVVMPGELIVRADLEQLGNVIGIVDINPVHHADHCTSQGSSLCSPWAEPGMWHWPLTNPQPLRAPIPAKGQLGLWNWDQHVIGNPAPATHVQEFSPVPYSVFCSCGYVSTGTEDDPALFEYHLRCVTA